MKKRKITADDLKQTLPPMPEAFEKSALYTIHSMPKTKERPVMKRKIPAVLVFALVLVLAISAVAFAYIYWRDTTEKVAPMEAEHGYFDTWSPEDKVALVIMLHESGALPDDPRIDRLQSEKLTEQEKNDLAVGIMTEWMGSEEWAITLDRMAEKLHGLPFDEWLPEDKAWFTEMLRENGLLSGEDIIYALPSAADVDQETAITLAKQALTQEYDLPAGYLDDFLLNPGFYTPTWDVKGVVPGDSIWNVEFTKPIEIDGESAAYIFMVELDKHGNVLDCARNNPYSLGEEYNRMIRKKGPFYMWSMEDQAVYSEELPRLIAEARKNGEEIDRNMETLGSLRFGFPGDHDITEAQAIAAATAYVKEHYRATDAGLAKLKAYVSFDITNPEQPIWRIKLLAWLVESYADYESIGYVVHIESRTGEVIKSLNRSTDDWHAVDLI